MIILDLLTIPKLSISSLFTNTTDRFFGFGHAHLPFQTEWASTVVPRRCFFIKCHLCVP